MQTIAGDVSFTPQPDGRRTVFTRTTAALAGSGDRGRSSRHEAVVEHIPCRRCGVSRSSGYGRPALMIDAGVHSLAWPLRLPEGDGSESDPRAFTSLSDGQLPGCAKLTRTVDPLTAMPDDARSWPSLQVTSGYPSPPKQRITEQGLARARLGWTPSDVYNLAMQRTLQHLSYYVVLMMDQRHLRMVP